MNQFIFLCFSLPLIPFDADNNYQEFEEMKSNLIRYNESWFSWTMEYGILNKVKYVCFRISTFYIVKLDQFSWAEAIVNANRGLISKNSTIFNIINWDNGSKERPSHRLMVQCLIWWIENNSVRQWLSGFDLGHFKLFITELLWK